MRRKDREVQSLDEIFDILNRCDTVRVAFRGEEYPYVVPVSFGTELADGKVTVYFHCAREGLKLELLKKDPHICLEGDIFIRSNCSVASGIMSKMVTKKPKGFLQKTPNTES